MYTSKTTTEAPSKALDSDITFSSNSTHQVISVVWEYCNHETTVVKVTSYPFKVVASSFDGTNHHNFEFSLRLTHDITTMEGSFYDFDGKGFRIHIPKENMVKRKGETVTLLRRE